MLKTYWPKKIDKKEEWHFVDARGQVLGKLATAVTQKLLGKNSALYTPGVLSGNHVVVTNAGKVAFTGNKKKAKVYYRHSDYPGGLKEEKLGHLMDRAPEKVIENAVKGMLPNTKLKKKYLANLHIYPGSEHPHVAQEKVEN